MGDEMNPFSVNPLLQDFYRMAEQNVRLDPEELNAVFHELLNVSQRYQSPRVFAEGGMKRIYKVYDARGKRFLALAMLREDAHERLRDPFIQEAWLTARLDHPNIISVHDVGVKDGQHPYFTMDLKHGMTLRDLIVKLKSGDRKTRDQYPLETLLQIFLKVCDAVSYAHSVNVVHLDLKPANIQIGEYGRVLVCDWGLGRKLSHKNSQESDPMQSDPVLMGSASLYGEFKGTPGYMAPEQLEQDGTVDERSDIYGLGCILYSLLTFQRPLDGDDDEMIRQTKEGAIVPPDQRAPEQAIPSSLNAVTMRALATDPGMRYASVDALRHELQRFLTGFATEAEHAGVLKQLSLFYRRNRRFCITVLSSLLLITVSAVWAFRALSEKERLASEAKLRAERTLALYEAGQTELEKVNAANVDSIVRLSNRYLFAGDSTRAGAVLETALQEHSGNDLLQRSLGVIHFCNQRFKEAIPLLDVGIYKNGELTRLAEKFADKNPDESWLSVDDLIDCLRGLQDYKPQALAMVLLDQKHRPDLEERAKVIEAYLRTINPEWLDGWFEYDQKSGTLRMGGRGLKTLSIQHSVLVGLNLRDLNISGSEVSKLWNEGVLGLERLDIRGTPIKEAWFLKQMPHLQELIITPNQLSMISHMVPQWVQVIERSYP